ncbi:MAG TPA: tetratricopeptide repeat protein [Verrucomicrobiae bacterium]|nr:tetratricopeptide repeat protein [Verrucomicrobiae bacterium]
MRLRKFMPLLIIAAGIGAYHNSFRDGFVFDDTLHITEDPSIRQLWRPWAVLAHTSRPVVHLSLAVNYALGRLDPWGYHVFNVGIHVLAALTLYGVLRRTLVSEMLRSSFGGAAPFLAGVISLIWLVHPLQTESVTYTIQRAESLMGLFFLLTLYCVIRSHGSPRRNLWEISAVVSCALGMASKPVMVTAPVVILIYDRVFLATSWREALRRRGWLYAGLAATCLLLCPLLAQAPSEWKASAGFEYHGTSPWRYALNQPIAVLHYLRLTFWPHPLCLDYSGGLAGLSDVPRTLQTLPALIIVAAMLAGTIWAWKRSPAIGFVGAWFFIILAPTSSFLPVADEIVEHRMYLPLAAPVAATVLGAFALGKRLFSNRQGVTIGCVTAGSVMVLLTSLTIQRNRDYGSELLIWQDTVEKRPNNPRAHCNFGLALVKLGKPQAAVGHYEQALRLKPDYAEAHNNLGIALVQLGKLQEAVGHYEQALRIRPDYAGAHNNLGLDLVQLGRLPEAIGHWEQAVRIQPDYAEARNNLGNALLQAGKVPEAIAQYEQALRINPDLADAHENLGVALVQAGRVEEAIGQYQQSLQIDPQNADAHISLGNIFLQEGKLGEAIGHYEQAARIRPDSAEAHCNLGTALMGQGRLPEAIGQYEQALRIKPDLADAQYNLGIALMGQGRASEAIGHYEQALRIKPDEADVHYNLGVALEQAGRQREAVEHYEQALRIRPDFVEARSNLARARAVQ